MRGLFEDSTNDQDEYQNGQTAQNYFLPAQAQITDGQDTLPCGKLACRNKHKWG